MVSITYNDSFSISKSTAFGGGALDEGHIVGPREAASNQILGGQDEVKKIIDLPGRQINDPKMT